MGVKAKDKKIELIHRKVCDGIQKAVAELYDHHSGEIQENLDDSESKKVSVSFACEVDCSESEPLVTVRIRFSASITDKRVFRVDDPNQLVLYTDAKAAMQGVESDGEGELAGEPKEDK